MSEIRIATRYAKGLLRCLQDHELEQAGEALNRLADLFSEGSVGKVLCSPVIPSDLKVQILEYGLDQVSAPATLKAFVKVLTDGRRVNLLPHVAGAFERLVNERAGKINVTVTSATSLTSQELDELRTNLTKALAMEVKLSTEQDPAILGGIVLEMGHRKLDLSLKTKIERLAQSAIS